MINELSKHEIGSWSFLNDKPEVKKLVPGLDFREPQYRRETFMRFYEFHLKYRSHPGAVYFMFPYLKKEYNLSKEDMLWMTFINGMSQNIVTTWTLFQEFPDFRVIPEKIQAYIMDNWAKLGWDMDRRYVKTKFGAALECYQKLIGDQTQVEYWNSLCSSDNEYTNFNNCWKVVYNDFAYFGRLSTFSYLEYQRIIGLNLDCDSLFLDDMSGSKSHRNGLCVVLGRDDMDWHDTLNPGFDGYKPEHIKWLKHEGKTLLLEAQFRFADRDFIKDVSYFTLESTLCCYKSWHRKNRRYPNVYMDMFHDRIKFAENAWGSEKNFDVFWEARASILPDNLRLECTPGDPGLKPIKQNHYLETGQVIMMDKEWECFKNDFNSSTTNNGILGFL